MVVRGSELSVRPDCKCSVEGMNHKGGPLPEGYFSTPPIDQQSAKAKTFLLVSIKSLRVLHLHIFHLKNLC